MQKIIKLLKALQLVLKRPALLNLILKDEAYLLEKFTKAFPKVVLQELDPFTWEEANELKITPYAFSLRQMLPVNCDSTVRLVLAVTAVLAAALVPKCDFGGP